MTAVAAALEIAVQDPAGAVVARHGGADRVELCAALGATGGLTPSAGLLAAVCAVGIDVHALIRTRPGGFVYSEAEVDVLVADVEAAVRAGAAGVVVGALTADGSVDSEATTRLVEAARSAGRAVDRRIEVTFHRAIDAASDPVAAITLLGGLGVDRVLTSGGAAKAGDGIAVLGALVAANTGVQVMAGGGVDVASIPRLMAAGVDAVHLSAKRSVPDPGSAGPGGGSASELETTDPDLVAAAASALRPR
ncbi:copper homeostasis protein CutC [Gordonia neofelifaecis]|uniref:PF03932 family protein CutC n=1 Tax=Gordonia neofelifaecis NRRL B-59395 TaxID=644548 RepID=F1YH28_9ACTN|nr:copper homeostasis protein CutC [Gordonia neofelifaecis]EGD55943.1 copper homeostasis protein [Gordonia neofelifaecis NRRL B-59395]